MKKLLVSTTALSVALSPFHMLPVSAQSIMEDGSVLAADGVTVLCTPTAEAACDLEAILKAIAEGDAAAQAEAQAAAEAGAAAAAQAEAEAQAAAAAAQAEAEAQAAAAAAAQAEVEAQAAAAAQAEAEAQAAAAAQAEAEAQAAAAAQAEAEAQAAAAAQAEAEAQAAAAAQAEAEAQAAAAAQAEAEAQAAAAAQAEAEAQAAAAAQAEAEAQAAAAAQAEAEAQAAAAAQAEADAKAAEDAAKQAEADAKAAEEAAAVARAEADAKAAADAAIADQTETEAKPTEEPAPAETTVEPAVDPTMETTAEPAVEPAAEAPTEPAVEPAAEPATTEATSDPATDAAVETPVETPVEAPVEALVPEEQAVEALDSILALPSAGEGLAEEAAPVAAAAAALAAATAIEGGEPVPTEGEPAPTEGGTDAPAPEGDVEPLPPPVATEVVETIVTEANTRTSGEEFAAAPTAVEGGKKSGLSDLEKVGLVALGALIVGVILNDGKEVVQNTGDRVVVKEPDGTYTVYKDDDALLRRPGVRTLTETYQDGSTLTRVQRADGTEIVTIRDASGRVLRRAAYDRAGNEMVLIDDLVKEQPIIISDLPKPKPSRVVISTSDGNAALKAELAALEAEELGRKFSLRQIREIREVRALAATIEVDSITFDSGSSVIKATEARKLADLGRVMAELLDRNAGEVFLIEGHTDAVGSASSNLSLSDRRAESVALALTEYFDIPPENIVIQGYGESELKVETTADERANRRVAIRLITPLMRTAALR